MRSEEILKTQRELLKYPQRLEVVTLITLYDKKRRNFSAHLNNYKV